MKVFEFARAFACTHIPLAVLLVLMLPPGAQARQEWTTFRGGGSLAGAADVDVGSALAERWRFRTGEPPSGTPVGGGGTVYLVTDRGKVFAVSLDEGTLRWQVKASADPAEGAGTEHFTAPALLAGETLVFGSRRGTLYALDTDTGEERWRYDVGGPVTAAPNLFEGGEEGRRNVLVTSQPDGVVHSVDLASGRRTGASPPTNRCDGAAAVSSGVAAYGNCDAALYLLSAESLKITGKIALIEDGQVFAGVALAGNTVYAGDRNGRLYAASVAEGRLLWVNEEGGDDISSTPAVHDGRVVYTSDDGSVAALDGGTGRTLWRTALDARPGSPVITSGGQVIVGADGTLHLLGLADGVTIWSRTISDDITSPAVIDGLIIVASDDGFLIAFGTQAEEGKKP